MFYLQLLGGLSLRSSNGESLGRATQRRRLALLAVLARAPQRTATRDRLIGMLWPECPEEEARARLSSAIYDLRRALGSTAVESHGDDVSLNGCELEIDAQAFERAATSGDWAEAQRLYAGPFLDGVFLDNTEEFERWTAAQRDRLHQIWQRVGQAAGADGGNELLALNLNGNRSEPLIPPTTQSRSRLLKVVLVAAIVIGPALAATWVRRPAPPSSGITRIAVLPFRIQGGPPDLRNGLADLLSLDLDGAGEIRTVDAGALLAGFSAQSSLPPARLGRRALELGATHQLIGFAHLNGDRLRVGAALTELGTDHVAIAAQVEGPADSLGSLVDRLSRDILRGLLGSPGNRIARTAVGTTSSLPALKAWLAGEAALRQGRYSEAADAFEHAADLDSTFALAHYRYSLATLWGDRPGASTERHDALALRNRDRLAPRDAQLLEAYAAWRAGVPNLAEQRYRQILVTWPDDVEAWYQLGETLFHYNSVRGRAVAESRYAFERVRLLDPSHRGARRHLAFLDALAGQTQRFRHQLEQLVSEHERPADELELYGLSLAASGIDAIRSEKAVLQNANEAALASLTARIAIYLGDYPSAETVARLLLAPERNDYANALGRTALAQLARVQGRLRDAARFFDDAPAIGPAFDMALTRACDLIHWWGAPRREIQSALDTLRATARTLEPTARVSRLYGIGLLELLAGGRTGVDRVIGELAALRTDSSLARDIRLALLGLRATREGSPRDALRLFEQMGPPGWFGHLLSGSLRGDPLLRFARAEALMALGRDDEAFAWYGTFGEHALRDLAYLAPAHFRRGEILERRGKPDQARREFARVVILWNNADPELQPWVEKARAHLRDQRNASLGMTR